MIALRLISETSRNPLGISNGAEESDSLEIAVNTRLVGLGEDTQDTPFGINQFNYSEGGYARLPSKSRLQTLSGTRTFNPQQNTYSQSRRILASRSLATGAEVSQKEAG
jgi:hypothetical protein